MNEEATDRQPSHDLEAERCILGAMLVYESVVPSVRAVLRPDQFFTPAHATICTAIFTVAESETVSLLSVKNELARNGELASVGHGGSEIQGIDYLMELGIDWSWDWQNVPYQLKTIIGAAVLRRLLSLSQKMGGDVTAGGVQDAPELIQTYQKQLAALELGTLSPESEGVGLLRASETVEGAIKHADQVQRKEIPMALMTGFGAIDDATGGMQPGDLWTLAAATSVGKTALALAITANVVKAGGTVLYASAEMNHRALANRLLAAQSGIMIGRLRTGNLNEPEYEAREIGAAEIMQWNLGLLSGATSAADIAIRARDMVSGSSRGLSLIVVDYLQLLRPSAGETRAQQVSAVAWDLKGLAMQMRTPVLMLSQLSRHAIREGKPPTMYGIKESGDVENHSSVVLMLHWPTPPQYDTDGALLVWVRVAKCREGRTTLWPQKKNGTRGIVLRFKRELARFESRERSLLEGEGEPQ